jgi:hypothetical protein
VEITEIGRIVYKGIGYDVVTANLSVAAATVDAAVLAAGGAGLRIYVIAIDLHAGAAPPTTITFNTKPAGAGSAISPAYPQIANGQKWLGHGDHPLCSTGINEGLTATTAAGTNITVGTVWYFLAP